MSAEHDRLNESREQKAPWKNCRMAHKLLNFEEDIEGLDGGSPYMLLVAAAGEALRMGTEFGVLVVGTGYLRKEK